MERAMVSWSAVRMGSRVDDGLAGGSVGRSAREERIGGICLERDRWKSRRPSGVAR